MQAQKTCFETYVVHCLFTILNNIIIYVCFAMHQQVDHPMKI